jgi:hypothetical protein
MTFCRIRKLNLTNVIGVTGTVAKEIAAKQPINLLAYSKFWPNFQLFLSRKQKDLLETFFVYEFYSSSPITGFLLVGYIGTILYK